MIYCLCFLLCCVPLLCIIYSLCVLLIYYKTNYSHYFIFNMLHIYELLNYNQIIRYLLKSTNPLFIYSARSRRQTKKHKELPKTHSLLVALRIHGNSIILPCWSQIPVCRAVQGYNKSHGSDQHTQRAWQTEIWLEHRRMIEFRWLAHFRENLEVNVNRSRPPNI